MKPAGRRTKGHSWERQTAIFLRELDPNAKRLLEYQEGFYKDIATSLPLSIQCKNQLNPNPWKALEEAEKGRKDVRDIAVAFVKKTRKGEIVCMRKETWLMLAKAYFKTEEVG